MATAQMFQGPCRLVKILFNLPVTSEERLIITRGQFKWNCECSMQIRIQMAN